MPNLPRPASGTTTQDISLELRVDGSASVDGTGGLATDSVSFGVQIPGPEGPEGPQGPVGPPGVPIDSIGMSAPGTLVVSLGAIPLPILRNLTFVRSRLAVGTAPMGSDVVFDINKNGVTVFTNQANRPRVLAGSTVSAEAVPDVTSVSAGDVITVDIDQVGSVVPGANATLMIEVA